MPEAKVLVIGSGGREHALCWKLADSPYVKQIYCAPGSVGISSVDKVENLDIDIKDYPVSLKIIKITIQRLYSPQQYYLQQHLPARMVQYRNYTENQH